MGQSVVATLESGNSAEFSFGYQADKLGWNLYRHGWPDFLVEREGELFAVEVKQGKDELNERQKATLSALDRAGIPCFVWRPDTGFELFGSTRPKFRIETIRIEGIPAFVCPNCRSPFKRKRLIQRFCSAKCRKEAWFKGRTK